MLPIASHAIDNACISDNQCVSIATTHLFNRFLNLIDQLRHPNKQITICALTALPHRVITTSQQLTLARHETAVQIPKVDLTDSLLYLDWAWLVDNVGGLICILVD